MRASSRKRKYLGNGQELRSPPKKWEKLGPQPTRAISSKTSEFLKKSKVNSEIFSYFLAQLNLAQNPGIVPKFESGTKYHEDYVAWPQEQKRPSSIPPKLQPQEMPKKSVYGRDF